MNYTYSKKKIDAIRHEYGCKGDVIFRTAIQYIVEHGQNNFKDETWFDECINDVDERHDLARHNGKTLWITRDFEKAILECARELAFFEPYDLLIYIQREVWLGGEGISYQTAISLLINCMESIAENHEGCHDTLEELYSIGFDDYEIEELGHGYLLDAEEDEE